MFRRFVPLAVLVLIVVGCAKKKDDDPGSGGSPDGGDPVPTGPAYTIKLRDEQEGDKSVVTQSGTTVVTHTASGPKGKQSNTKKEPVKIEFTETILEKPAEAQSPTKITHAYKVVEKGEPLKSLSYAGKTVTIEKKGTTYSYTVNGKRLPAAEEKTFRDNFENPAKFRLEDFLPKKSVQVYEKWAIDSDVVLKAGVLLNLPATSKDKSTGTGRLTRAYTKDGKQWGVIETTFALVIDRAEGGVTGSGNVTFASNIDTPIDGSSREWTKTIKVNGKVTQSAKGLSVETTMEIDGVETRTPIK